MPTYLDGIESVFGSPDCVSERYNLGKSPSPPS